MEKPYKSIILFSGILAGLFFSACYGDSTKNVRLQQFLDNFRNIARVPAAVLTVNYPDGTLLTFVSGTIENKEAKNAKTSAVTGNNLFQIGSVTKSFTAAIILQLEAEGKLSINDTIADTFKKYGKWLPDAEYQAWKNVTVKQLLNMTSGIFDVVEDKKFMNTLAQHPEKNWTPLEIIKYTEKHAAYFPPGTGWRYSNTAYNILGLLIEVITKHSFETEINQRILKPNSLSNTYYLPYKYPKNIMSRMAHGYVYANDEFSPPMKPGQDMTAFNLSAAGPSGALVSNSIDITRWVRLLFTGHIVPAPQLTEMLDVVCMGSDKSCEPGKALAENSRSVGFSLGLVRMYDPQLGVIWFYKGSTPGYYSSFVWLPERKIALALTVSATTRESSKLLKTLVDAAKMVVGIQPSQRHLE